MHYLAQWVDLGWLLPEDGGPFPGGLGRLRELIQASAELSRWRGTKRGLVQFLELATGLDGFAIDESAPGPGRKAARLSSGGARSRRGTAFPGLDRAHHPHAEAGLRDQ